MAKTRATRDLELITECADCGQQNRLPTTLPAGKKVICGACHADLDDEVECPECDGTDDTCPTCNGNGTLTIR